MNAKELRAITDKAREPYTLKYILTFCEGVASRGDSAAAFQANRWTDDLTGALRELTYTVEFSGLGSVVVGW